MEWDGEAREAARSNRALVTREAVFAAGGSDTSIQGKLASCEWRLLHPGVYHLDLTAPGWTTSVRAATLAAGPGSLASHRTAAVLYGLDGISGQMIELTVPYNNQPIPEGVIVHRTRRVLPSHVIEGIPVITVERTLLDLAGIVGEITLEKALMSAIRKQLTTPDEIGSVFTEQGGRGVRGTKKARRVLARVDDGITGSPSEVAVIALLRGTPIELPVVQHKIPLPEGGNFYPDFAWPDRMKIVEVDGYGAHSTPDQLHNDLVRQNRLMELGWEIRRFSARAVRRDPGAIIAAIVDFVDH